MPWVADHNWFDQLTEPWTGPQTYLNLGHIQYLMNVNQTILRDDPFDFCGGGVED